MRKSAVLEPARFPGGALRGPLPCRISCGKNQARSKIDGGLRQVIQRARGRLDVASEARGAGGLAERYATALFALADERRVLDAVASDLATLRALLDESADLRRLIRSPVIARGEQGRAIEALAERAGLQPITRNFLGLLAKNRRLFALPDMIRHFLDVLAERRGEVTAEIAVAQELSQDQRQRITAELARAAGQKVTLDIRVDPSLLGGLTVRLGSRLVNASIKDKLHRLEMAMKGVR